MGNLKEKETGIDDILTGMQLVGGKREMVCLLLELLVCLLERQVLLQHYVLLLHISIAQSTNISLNLASS